jgi:hypothetical protein
VPIAGVKPSLTFLPVGHLGGIRRDAGEMISFGFIGVSESSLCFPWGAPVPLTVNRQVAWPIQQFGYQSIGFFADQMAVAASDAIRSAMS